MNTTALVLAAMMTAFGEKVTPENAWREYPRPQMVRDNWTCLNGKWNYTITSNVVFQAKEIAKGEILVPFCFESPLSGVERLIEPWETMVYERTIELNPKANKRILLNFEASDWRTHVYLNDVEVDLPHEGGLMPFSYDITDFAKPGINKLKVLVWDPTWDYVAAGGKQNHESKGCFYTRVSGIWQTVWLEEVPTKYIRDYKVFPDIDKGTVRFEFDKVGEGEVQVDYDLPKNFEMWSPENPKLYTFTARFGEDVIKGYFAMRKFAKAKDAHGEWRFTLNNKFFFPMGPLDQGWWPDGLLTPASEAAMEYDIKTLKACGYNMMRKHIKVESRRYYAMCDKLGLVVFQDAPSPAGRVCIFDEKKNNQRYGMFRKELKEEVDMLQKVPCIGMWIPFNEGWGQPNDKLTADALRWVKRYDRTRLVGGPSGWSDWEGGDVATGFASHWHKERDYGVEPDEPSADTVDRHAYRGPGQCKNHKNRISFLGEFGGLGHPVEGHLWNKTGGSWGYGGIEDTKTPEGLEKVYLEILEKMEPMIKEGLAGAVYTQTSDVEQEINGILTYDRKVLKFKPEVLKAAHEKLYRIAEAAAK